MAIVKGIERDAVLWKFVAPTRVPVRRMNTERGVAEYARNERGHLLYEDGFHHYLVRLETRRARTVGANLDNEIIPFLEKLKIRIEPGYSGKKTAVGCNVTRVSKELYDSTEIDPIAQKYYMKIKNRELVSMIHKFPPEISRAPIEKLKSIDLTAPPEPEEWPEEPEFNDTTPQFARRGRY